jgi:hypothetical protein
MSYTIKLTNDSTLAVIADQTYDQVSTSIVLVGKNLNNYGEYLNNNFIGLLENFADIIEPRSPIVGQTWFDKSEGRLKVYSTGTFKPVGGPTVSNIEPANAVKGDMWIDTVDGVLRWYDGSSFVDASKSYSDATGKEGWLVETIDSTIPGVGNFTVPISKFYSNGEEIAIATDADIPLNPFTSYFGTSTIRAGITLNPNIPGIRFIGTATSAESVSGLSVDNVLTTDQDQEITGEYRFLNDTGVSFGIQDETHIQIYVDTSTSAVSVIESTINGEALEIRYNSVSTGTGAVAFHIDSANDRIGIFNNNPQVDVDINGSVHITGNLTVLGTQTSLEVSVLKVDDINVELGTNQDTPDDAFVDGGGIILHGTTDKTFTYEDLTGSWTSNIDLNVASGQRILINGASALEEYAGGGLSLGTGVVAAPSLTNLPVLGNLTISNVVIYSNTITTVASPLTDLYITPSSDQINLGTTTKIVGMKPTEDADPDDSAITKKYFEDKVALSLGGFVGRKPYVLSMDITDFGNVNDEIVAYLDVTLPVDGFGNQYYAQPDGSRCSVLCVNYVATTATYVIDNLNTSTVRTLLNYIDNLEYTNDGTSTSYISTLTTATQLVVTDFELAGSLTISTPQPIIERTVKLFQVQTGYWTFVEDVNTNYLTSNTPQTIQTATIVMTVNKEDLTNFNTGTNIILRETVTQLNYMTGPIIGWSGLDVTIGVTEAYDTANTGTYSAWIIRQA